MFGTSVARGRNEFVVGNSRVDDIQMCNLKCLNVYIYENWLFYHMRSIKTQIGVFLFCTIFNSLRPRRNRRHFADDIFKCIFLNENVWIPIEFSLKFVPRGPINNISALVQIMAWRRPGDKPLSEPMIVSLPTHICVTLPQWVNTAMQWQNKHINHRLNSQ